MSRFFAILATLAFTALQADSAEPSLPKGKAVNPIYTAWCRFPEGTVITVKSSGKASGIRSESYKDWWIIETTTLVSVSPQRVELKREITKATNGGKDVLLPAYQETHLRIVDEKLAAKPQGIIEESEKEIMFNDKPLKAKYTKIKEENFDAEGSVYIVEMWTSDTVPGGLIRQESQCSGTYWHNDSMKLFYKPKPVK